MAKDDALTVTRLEIAEHVASGFIGSPLTREQLVALAHRSGAQLAVERILQQLPDGQFQDVRQLWPALPDMPIEPAAPGQPLSSPVQGN